MESALQRFIANPVETIALGQLFNLAMQEFYTFILVFIRVSGLMIIGPSFGQAIIPPNIRALLVFTLAIIITPSLSNVSQTAFHRLDENRDGRLTQAEVPEQLEQQFTQLLVSNGKQQSGFLTASEFRFSLRMPSSLLDLLWTAVKELSLGLFLGLGVFIILSGLQLAGEMIDQQTGFSLGRISNPGMGVEGTITGQTLFMLGMTILLVLEPIGGHLMMLSSLLETFQTLPIGNAFVTTGAVDLLRDLVHQSLVLGVQVAAPLMAVMSLVALTMGFLGHPVPQVNVLVLGFPIRAMINLLILSVSFSGVGRLLVDWIPHVIDSMRQALTGLT